VEAQDVAISGIDTGDRATPHELNLTSNRDARHGGSSDVVVGNQKGIRHWTKHTDLMADVGEIWTSSWLDFTDDLERSWHPDTVPR
jgi:hypothetical protein